MSIGITALPDSFLRNPYLSQENILALASVDSIPVIDPAFADERLKNIVQYYSVNPAEMESEIYRYAGELLKENKIDTAWQVLLCCDLF